MTRYQLSIYATKLKRGAFRMPSVYAEVTVSGGPKEGTKIGRTEVLHNTLDPDWTTVLFLDELDSSVYMPLRVCIWDERVHRDNVLLGQANFEATEIYDTPGHTQHETTRDGMKIFASVEESQRGDSRGILSMHLRGLDIRNIEPGIMGLGRSDPFFEIAKKNADHAAGVVRWNVVYRSEHIYNHLNPFWEDFALGLEELCYCDLSWPIRVSVKDFQRNGSHRVIGQFETTLETLIKRVAIKGNADRDMSFEIFAEGKTKTQGLIVVLKADLQLDE